MSTYGTYGTSGTVVELPIFRGPSEQTPLVAKTSEVARVAMSGHNPSLVQEVAKKSFVARIQEAASAAAEAIASVAKKLGEEIKALEESRSRMHGSFGPYG